MCIPTIRELPYMTDFLKIAKSIVVHFAHICAYGVETVNFTKLRPLLLINLWSASSGFSLEKILRVVLDLIRCAT